VQILGQTELSFLHRLSATIAADPSAASRPGPLLRDPHQARATTTRTPPASACCRCPSWASRAGETGTPLLIADERSSVAINALHNYLDDRLAPRVRLHGVLVDVFGVGLLLVGSSAIGKSETALDLVMRGHRLVADDVVECDYRPPGMVFGARPSSCATTSKCAASASSTSRTSSASPASASASASTSS
jgi:HPr kinase/phosphorylase